MDSIFLDLRNDILDNKSSVVHLLKKALLIAQKLKLDEFGEWVNNELNGYENIDEVPKYREVQGQVKVWNPHKGIMMPVIFHSAEENKSLSTRKLIQKIAELESIDEKKDSSEFHISYPDNYAKDLVRKNNWSTPPVLIIERSIIHGIIVNVRDILLKWTSDLEERNIEGKGLHFTKDDKEIISNTGSINIKKIQQIFGDLKSSDVSLNNRMDIIAGDFNSLKKYLSEELKISEDDLSELEKAIKEDNESIQNNKLGNKVTAWISNTVTNAANGLLQLSDSTAGSLLTLAISKYYGF